jgi:hypothetical protein
VGWSLVVLEKLLLIQVYDVKPLLADWDLTFADHPEAEPRYGSGIVPLRIAPLYADNTPDLHGAWHFWTSTEQHGTAR